MPDLVGSAPWACAELVEHRLGTRPILVHPLRMNSWIQGWIRTLPLPRLFLIYTCAVLVPVLAAVSVVSLLILHDHWTGLSLGFMVYIALQSGTVATLGERSRRRREAASVAVIVADGV